MMKTLSQHKTTSLLQSVSAEQSDPQTMTFVQLLKQMYDSLSNQKAYK